MASSDSGVRLTVEAKALAGRAIAVTHFAAVEALDEPYSLSLELRIAEADVDVTALLGKDLAFTVERLDRRRRIVGLVRAVQEGRIGGDETRARLEVVPALQMLSLRRNTRMFQEQTVPEILEAVLGEALDPYGRTATQELNRTDYPQREYCMQYQETDLDFVTRLMEEEGISYAFDHDDEVETMVLRDSNDAFARIGTMNTLCYHSYRWRPISQRVFS